MSDTKKIYSSKNKKGKPVKQFKGKAYWDSAKMIVIVFSAIIPSCICIAVNINSCRRITKALRDMEMHATGTMDGAFQLSLFDTGISIIAIAVSVWVGLNIYNTCKESIWEKQLKNVAYENERLLCEYKRNLFYIQLEKTVNDYEVSKYLYKEISQQEDIDAEIFDDLVHIEKKFSVCCRAYEQKRWKECKFYADEVVKETQVGIIRYGETKNSVVHLYMQIRCSDALFYKNVSEKDNANCEELKCSIDKYEKVLNKLNEYINYTISKEYKEFPMFKNFKEFQENSQFKGIDEEDKELLGYMYNSIGYSYLKLCRNEMRTSDLCKKWKKIAERYLNLAAANNPKGRYLQNLGAYYEWDKKYDNALLCYQQAFKANRQDKKIYNLLGSLFLKIIDEKTGIDKRFEKRKIMKDICLEIRIDNELKILIRQAYMYLEQAVWVTPELIDVYYNFAKANLYYWLLIDNDEENSMHKKETAKLYIKLALQKNDENTGALFTQRNYLEAVGKIEKAMKINKKLRGIGDSYNAEETYRKYINN